jgi:two-component system NtrC family response regulator
LEKILGGAIPQLDATAAGAVLAALRRAAEAGLGGEATALWRAAAYEGLGELGLAEGELSGARFGDGARRGAARRRLAVLRRLQGNGAGAREAAGAALAEAGSKAEAGAALEILAGLHEEEGEIAEAEKALVKAAAAYKTAKEAGGRARALRRLAEVRLLEGKWAEAEATAEEAMAGGRERMGALTVLARLAARAGRAWEERLREAAGSEGSAEERVKLAAAAAELDSAAAEGALAAVGETGAEWRWEAELVKARVAHGKGDAAGANEAVRRLRAETGRGVMRKAELARLEGRMRLAAGNAQAAMMNLNVAVRAYVGAGLLWEQAECHELMSLTYEMHGAAALAASQRELAETLRNRLRAVETARPTGERRAEEEGHLLERVAAGRVSPEMAAEEFCAVMEEAFGRKATVGVMTDGGFEFLAGDRRVKERLEAYARGRRAAETEETLFRFDLGVEEEGRVWIHMPGAKEGRVKPFVQVCGLAIEAARLRKAEAARRPLAAAAAASGAATAAGLLGASEAMRRVGEMIERMSASRTTLPALILGESGTGKEVTARAIHRTSARGSGPFVAFNCGAVDRNLLLSELFGHVKGAFTGASGNAVGVIRTADKGTLFLDEIGDLGPEGQVALLRFLEEGEVRPVGSASAVKADVRIVAATNRNLRGMVEAGTFREDLFYRLNGILIELPPLRERREDVETLARHFLKEAGAENGAAYLSQGALEAMRNYGWPGNVRELRQMIRRAVSLAEADQVLSAADLGLEGGASGGGKADSGTEVKADFSGLTWREAVATAQTEILLQALRRNGNNYSATARALKLTLPGLRKRCQDLGITVSRLAGKGPRA